jgi:hypothetical protein
MGGNMKSQKGNTALILLYCFTMTVLIGCGKEKDSRKSPNVIDRNLLATLSLKSCEGGPCKDDPCASRQKSDRTEGSQIEIA